MQDTSAERALIALVLERGNEVFDTVDLDAADFRHPGHRRAWEVLQALRASGGVTNDLIAFEREMGQRLEASGGLSYFTEPLTTHAPVPSLAPQYADSIRHCALTRRAVDALSELLHGELEGEELVGAAMTAAVGLADHRAGDRTVTIGEATREACDELSREDGMSGVPTGFAELDAILGGLQRGVMSILAARPSMGKSSLARSLSSHAAAEGFGVHTFSLEDTRTSLALREISDRARVSGERLRSRDLQHGHMADVGKALHEIRGLKGRWLVDDTMGLSVPDIALRVRRHRRENETALVVVDHAQLLRDNRVPAGKETALMSLVSQELSLLARQEDVAVLLVSQLNRDVERRENKRPILADLRNSGSLEQDAYAVLMLYRDEYYYGEKSEAPGICEVLVRKNKNGRTGDFDVAWDAETATMRPLSRREEAA